METKNKPATPLPRKPTKAEKEWANLVEFARDWPALQRWLHARNEAFFAGDPTEGYTRATRQAYRAILRELGEEA
jgi:hypothetical protein